MAASRWKELLVRGSWGAAAAASLRDAALADAATASALDELAGLAADESLSARQRATALLAVSMVAAIADLPLPGRAVEAVEDAELVDTALADGMADAVTGPLRQAPADASVRALRSMVAGRLLAAGDRSPRVVALLIDAGDFDRAVRAAAEQFVAEVMPAVDRPTVVAEAWGGIALGWLADYPDRIFRPLRDELARRDPTAPAALARLIGKVRGADPALVDAARGVLVRSGEPS
jgi:hypothetical protein